MLNKNIRIAKDLIRIARSLVAMSYQYVADKSKNNEGDIIHWGKEDEWHHEMHGFTGLIDFGKSSCRVKDAYFTLKGDMIEWEKGWLMQGTFYGNWKSGTNDGGTFLGGKIIECDWLSGDFLGGEAGSDVVFHSGNLNGGLIIGATIDRATINGAKCENCEMKNGKFLSGRWEGGKWLSREPEPSQVLNGNGRNPNALKLDDQCDFYAEMEKAIRMQRIVEFNYMKRDGTVEVIDFLPIELQTKRGRDVCVGWKNGDVGNEEMKRTLFIESMGSKSDQMEEIKARRLNTSDTENPRNIKQMLEDAMYAGEFVSWLAETMNGSVFQVTGKPLDISYGRGRKLMCTYEATNGQHIRYGIQQP